jgi:hypothetical protein
MGRVCHVVLRLYKKDAAKLTYMDPPALSRALERKNTFRDRCSHISDLSVKVSPTFGP